MSDWLSLSKLRDMPTEAIIRRLDGKVESILRYHRVGDPWPTISVLDYCYVAELVTRLARSRLDGTE